MHIPDGYLSGEAAAAGAVVAAGSLAVCVRKAREQTRERDLPVAGMIAAFFVVADTPIFPVTVGTDGHLLGGTLAVALLGPWLGAITMTVVTVIEALALGDGGISTLGLNVIDLALIPAFVGYPLILGLRRLLPNSLRGLSLDCGIAALITIVVASCVFTFDYAIAAVVHVDLQTIAGDVIGTYALIGVIEGVMTALIVAALLRTRPDLVRVAGRLPPRRASATPVLVKVGEAIDE